MELWVLAIYVISALIFLQPFLNLIGVRRKNRFGVSLFVVPLMVVGMVFLAPGLFGSVSEGITIGFSPNNQTVEDDQPRCIIFEDTGSRVYLESAYGHDVNCDITEENLIYKVTCKEGMINKNSSCEKVGVWG